MLAAHEDVAIGGSVVDGVGSATDGHATSADRTTATLARRHSALFGAWPST